ncbi:Uncharacterised protein [Mycobacteroides abscessus subsp. abscessus]|nr:Uncharacterised protein [Mycobacteroides abscessus subsp. abscessus]
MIEFGQRLAGPGSKQTSLRGKAHRSAVVDEQRHSQRRLQCVNTPAHR